MGIIFNSSARGAMVVKVVGKPCSPLSSGDGSADKPPGKGFSDGRKLLGSPDTLENLVGLRTDASGSLVRKLD